jgi:hypothetical protein
MPESQAVSCVDLGCQSAPAVRPSAIEWRLWVHQWQLAVTIVGVAALVIKAFA